MLRLLALLSSLAAAPAMAATVNEVTDFSDDWFAPSPIAAGATEVTGVVRDLDVLQLQGLAAGAQSLRFSFSAAPYYTSGNYMAGGTILFNAAPFRWGWDGQGQTGYRVDYNSWNVGTPWFGQRGALTSTVELLLGADFAGGVLNLALVPWNELPLSYSISYASTAPVAPQPIPAVPLPLPGVLLGSLALLGWGLRRRKR